MSLSNGSSGGGHRLKTALVTGANGFIGHAVAVAFAAAGYKTYGLVRRETALQSLAAAEVLPVLGAPDADLAFLPALLTECPAFDVVVSATEQMADYVTHYEDIIRLLRQVAEHSGRAGVRPLVLFTSGCKDYGRGTLADDPALAAHTEDAPIAPEPWAQARARNAPRVFDHNDLFDAVLFRPVTLYGFDGSYYGPYLEMAGRAAEGDRVLRMPTHPRTVLHGMHVHDVARAYVAVTEADRVLVRAQCFNLSGRRWETAEEIAAALVQEYGLERVEYVEARSDDDWARRNAQFTQWVGSERIRKLLGWTDVKPTFTEGVHIYRIAYEAASASSHEGVLRIKGKLAPVA